VERAHKSFLQSDSTARGPDLSAAEDAEGILGHDATVAQQRHGVGDAMRNTVASQEGTSPSSGLNMQVRQSTANSLHEGAQASITEPCGPARAGDTDKQRVPDSTRHEAPRSPAVQHFLVDAEVRSTHWAFQKNLRHQHGTGSVSVFHTTNEVSGTPSPAGPCWRPGCCCFTTQAAIACCSHVQHGPGRRSQSTIAACRVSHRNACQVSHRTVARSRRQELRARRV
jgi:hypothetical protein